jgi:uncharacterized protein (DUF697 family)
MSLFNSISPMWKTFSEIDISAIRDEAEQAPRLALVGAGDKTSAFQRLLQHGPRSAEQLVTAIPIYHLPLETTDLAALAGYDLRIVLLDDAEQARRDDLRSLLAHPAPILLVQDPSRVVALSVDPSLGGQTAANVRSVACSLDDQEAVKKELLPAVLKLLPDHELSAGRAYPGLRPAVAHKVIQSTSKVNAGYAAGTGVAQMVPGLGIPFAVADMVILTKNQVVMAYKLGMLMGESGTLAEIVPKVAGVVGAGFMWRQVARELVGFLPLGVVLKTAVAYAGTYATGQAVYHYFVTGEKLRQADLRRVFDDAMARGREVAASVVEQVRAKREHGALLEMPAGKPARKKIKLPVLGKRQPV